MALLLGDSAGAETAKGMLGTILEHSPSMNKKSFVSRLVFLARVSAVYRMEADYLTKEDKTKVYIRFEDDMKDAFIASLNILKTECDELQKDNKAKKRKIEETTTDDTTTVLPTTKN